MSQPDSICIAFSGTGPSFARCCYTWDEYLIIDCPTGTIEVSLFLRRISWRLALIFKNGGPGPTTKLGNARRKFAFAKRLGEPWKIGINPLAFGIPRD